jgi:hypothetical protein
MKLVAEYRKFAEEYRKLSDKSVKPTDKEALKLMARAWEKVAAVREDRVLDKDSQRTSRSRLSRKGSLSRQGSLVSRAD